MTFFNRKPNFLFLFNLCNLAISTAHTDYHKSERRSLDQVKTSSLGNTKAGSVDGSAGFAESLARWASPSFWSPGNFGLASESVDNTLEATTSVIGRAECNSYFILGARGTNEVEEEGSIAYNRLVNTVLHTIPGGEKKELPYMTNYEYLITVQLGVNTGISIIQNKLDKCPGTQIVLLGYSKGAMVQTQIIAKLKTLGLIPNIAAVGLFGNPYYISGAPQDRCSGRKGNGLAAIALLGPSMPSIPPELISRVNDCCVSGDAVCQSVGSIPTHMTAYGGRPQDDVTNFVIRKLKARLRARSSSFWENVETRLPISQTQTVE